VSEEKQNPMILSLEGGNAQPLSVRAKALVFSDPVSAALLDYIERIAPSEAPVLIGGETGTGKELVARHIHHLSGRKGPFLAVNCGAISDQLAESELFGHEAGSFTGATGKREGWFEAANGGTLFLDEIGDLPLPLQVKLLRVLQEREVVRIGSRKSIAVDVRLVAATNVDLDYAVTAGHFRRDLLYRINIAHLRLPPLRERPGDVLPLAEYFLRSYSQRMGFKTPSFSPAAAELMVSYAWPGNIRELENVIHFALLVSGKDTIEPEHVKVTGGWEAIGGRKNVWQEKIPGHAADPSGVRNDNPLDIIAQQLKRLFRAETEDAYFDQLEGLIVNEAFNYSNHNQVHTAALLGISRNVMRTLLKRHGLLRDSTYDVGNDNHEIPLEHHAN
jgi:DNA-binding NtrC family response regulator